MGELNLPTNNQVTEFVFLMYLLYLSISFYSIYLLFGLYFKLYLPEWLSIFTLYSFR